MSGSWRASTTAAITGGTILNGQTPLHQHRHRLPMSDERELRPRRAPYKGQESAAAPKGTALRATQRARRAKTDRCYQPSHRPQLPMSAERELRPRRAPVKYRESDDDERTPLLRAAPRTQRAPRAAPDRRYQATHRAPRVEADRRYRATHRAPRVEADRRYRATHRAPRAEADRRYRATHRAPRVEADRRYRATHRAPRAEADRRYRERHRERIREKDRGYFKANQERILARQRRYRESHREEVRENQRRYRENYREEVREKQRRYRESHREELREKQRQRDARRRETHPELVREQNRIRQARFRAKKRMKKLMTLTIPLTDCRMPVSEYVQAFCDSLDAGDTNVSPPESFLQLLNEDSHTLLDLDSGALQVSEPSACNDLSFLQDLLSPDEWEQVMDDVQDFDVDDWLEDMTSSDEGVDLIYDLVLTLVSVI